MSPQPARISGMMALTIWEVLYLFFQYFVLAYFAVINLSYVLVNYWGFRAVRLHARRLSQFALKSSLERNVYIPISILVPAFNEEKSIVASVHSLLSLHYPMFEVIVTSDGSTDRTIELLEDAFGLVEASYHLYQNSVTTRPVKRIFRSIRYPSLLVIEKENGGRADALNAALNLARYPLVCAVDADSILDVDALMRTATSFVEDERVVAVGGTIRPLNGALVQNGQIQDLHLPGRWIERFQILEYSRSFFTNRTGWAALDMCIIISGAFGVIRRDIMLDIGGYLTNTVAEDMELTVRLHKYCRQKRQPYRIVFSPDPLCWTEVPSDLASLRRQRNRWGRGLWETLWIHRDMLFNPRYGRIGLFAIPYYLLFEGLSPLVEAFGYAFLVVSFLSGVLSVEFAFWFFLLSLAYGALLSNAAVGVEALLFKRYTSLTDRLILLSASVIEFIGYRQIMVWERLVAVAQVRSKRGQWGAMKRTGIS
jgi:cellulose synthase/poly-beta-1,6-N-acetylglucosamine synthase-like glycosyltransferase